MKSIKFYTAALLVALLAVSCDDSTVVENDPIGDVTLMFDNVVGEADLSLSTEESRNFPYVNELGQNFNIEVMGYYISEISLIGDNATYSDVVLVDAEASQGYYHVVEGETGSDMIALSDVPAGSYTQIKFTLGVTGETVQEGALGGVLNPEDGAWFWNWNAGYVAFKIEGNSEESGRDDSNLMTFHIGGWGEPNNVKEITLTLPTALVVADGTSSMAHIKVDALKAFTGSSDVDFSTTYAVHSPLAGAPIADNVESAFMVHHVMNDQ